MYKLFLTLRYLRKRRIAYFAIMAVALCVAMVLVVHSVMTGFLDTVRNNSRRLLGDVIVELGGMESFPFYEDFIQRLKTSMPDEIVAATPVIMNAGLMKIMGPLERDRTNLVMVNGIKLDEYRRINSFGEGLYYDTWYPNTTTFAPARMPRWYWDDANMPRLPQAYEQARAQHMETLDDPEIVAKYERQPLTPYPGPGFFHKLSEEEHLEGETDYTGLAHPGLIAGIELVARRTADGTYDREFPKGALIKLTVVSLTMSGELTADAATTAALRLVDDSRTKIYEIDKNNVYVDFDWLQTILGMEPQEYVDRPGTYSPARATQIQIKLAAGVDYNQASKRINRLWQEFADEYALRCDSRDAFLMKYMMVMTWEERNAGFILAVEKERILVLILFAIISMVAVLLVGCIFYMIVQEKTREIGIIKSMGATSRGIAAVFMIYGFWIGIVGSTIGTTIGTLFVYRINEFQDFLASIHPKLEVWNPEVYSFDRIPSTVNGLDAVIIVAVAILASVLGSAVASRKAARIWPVDAIRFE